MEEFIQYDQNGRMEYNPQFYHNQGKPYTVSEYEYICKFYETDGLQLVSLALGRTENSIHSLVVRLKRNGLFDYYRNLNTFWV